MNNPVELERYYQSLETARKQFSEDYPGDVHEKLESEIEQTLARMHELKKAAPKQDRLAALRGEAQPTKKHKKKEQLALGWLPAEKKIQPLKYMKDDFDNYREFEVVYNDWRERSMQEYDLLDIDKNRGMENRNALDAEFEVLRTSKFWPQFKNYDLQRAIQEMIKEGDAREALRIQKQDAEDGMVKAQKGLGVRPLDYTVDLDADDDEIDAINKLLPTAVIAGMDVDEQIGVLNTMQDKTPNEVDVMARNMNLAFIDELEIAYDVIIIDDEPSKTTVNTLEERKREQEHVTFDEPPTIAKGMAARKDTPPTMQRTPAKKTPKWYHQGSDDPDYEPPQHSLFNKGKGFEKWNALYDKLVADGVVKDDMIKVVDGDGTKHWKEFEPKKVIKRICSNTRAKLKEDLDPKGYRTLKQYIMERPRYLNFVGDNLRRQMGVAKKVGLKKLQRAINDPGEGTSKRK